MHNTAMSRRTDITKCISERHTVIIMNTLSIAAVLLIDQMLQTGVRSVRTLPWLLGRAHSSHSSCRSSDSSSSSSRRRWSQSKHSLNLMERHPPQRHLQTSTPLSDKTAADSFIHKVRCDSDNQTTVTCSNNSTAAATGTPQPVLHS